MIFNNRLTISVARELFESQRLKPSQLAQYCYSLAERTQSHFNAFSHLFTLEEILEAAVSSDQRYMDGHPKGMLDGIPISLKCNIAVKDKPWQASSNVLNGVIGYESIVSQKLKENGAIFIGSTNMDEFGMGSLGNNCNLGPTINPLPYLMHHSSKNNDKNSIDNLIQEIKSMTLPKWLSDTSVAEEYEYLSPGGSSSGSAASVAIGSSLVSIGTDTGGSVRLPAAWCGLVGLKPTYGSISRHGIIAYASSLDTVGIIANSVQCTSLTFDILKTIERESLEEIKDATAHPVHSISHIDFDLDGLRIGIPESFVVTECPSQIIDSWDKTLQMLENKNVQIVTIPNSVISHSTVKMTLPAYYVISSAEASSNLARYDGMKHGSSIVSLKAELNEKDGFIKATRGEGFGNEVKRRVLAGTAVLSSDRFHTYYEAATRVRAAITSQFQQAFSKSNEYRVDIIAIPTSMSNPPYFNEKSTSLDNTKAFQNDIMTTPISLAGLPSITLPILEEQPMIGMQFIGQTKSEDMLIAISKAIESTIIGRKRLK